MRVSQEAHECFDPATHEAGVLVRDVVELVPWPSVEEWAHFLYGRQGYHHLQYPRAVWTPQTPCQHSAHDSEPAAPPSDHRYVVNFCGTVVGIDLCQAHGATWHGMCTESIPWSKRIPKERSC